MLKKRRTRASDRVTWIEEIDVSDATPDQARALGFGETELDSIERHTRPHAPPPDVEPAEYTTPWYARRILAEIDFARRARRSRSLDSLEFHLLRVGRL